MSRSFGDGRYVVESALGAGGMGQVLLVRVLATGGLAALKTLRADLSEGPAVARLEREVTVMGRVNHPNVTGVFDFGVEPDGTPWFVMEYLDGRPLNQVLRDDGPLSAERAASLTMQIAGAVSAAHAVGVVHRDLKPSNVLVLQGPGGLEIAKVLDFGISALMGTESYHRLTGAGQVVGTPGYLAPEQLEGTAASASSDVYGLGVLLYCLLSGRRPYPGRSLRELVPAILAGARTPLSELRPELSGLVAIADRAMSVDPAERFASAEDMVEALDAFSQTRPVSSASNAIAGVGPLDEPTRIAWFQSPPMLAGLSVLMALLVAVLGWRVATRFSDPAGHADIPAAQDAKRQGVVVNFPVLPPSQDPLQQPPAAEVSVAATASSRLHIEIQWRMGPQGDPFVAHELYDAHADAFMACWRDEGGPVPFQREVHLIVSEGPEGWRSDWTLIGPRPRTAARCFDVLFELDERARAYDGFFGLRLTQASP